MEEEVELLIRLSTLKDVEIWLKEQYIQIQLRLNELEE